MCVYIYIYIQTHTLYRVICNMHHIVLHFSVSLLAKREEGRVPGIPIYNLACPVQRSDSRIPRCASIVNAISILHAVR